MRTRLRSSNTLTSSDMTKHFLNIASLVECKYSMPNSRAACTMSAETKLMQLHYSCSPCFIILLSSQADFSQIIIFTIRKHLSCRYLVKRPKYASIQNIIRCPLSFPFVLSFFLVLQRSSMNTKSLPLLRVIFFHSSPLKLFLFLAPLS